MAISFTVSGSPPRDLVRRMKDDLKAALKAAVAGATDLAKNEMRDAVRARSSSTRLPNIIRSKVYPLGKDLSYRPAGRIYAKGEKGELILKQLAEGATITVRNRKALAIPLHNQRGAGGKLRPPRDFPGLVYIPSKQRDGVHVGILALPSSRTKRGKLTAKDRRAQGAKSRARVQPAIGQDFIAMFVLVRSVRIPRAFDAGAIARRAVERLPGLLDAALAAQQRNGGVLANALRSVDD